jgi:hypothetical protein
MKELQLGEQIISYFSVFQDDGITPNTGLTGDNFTVLLINENNIVTLAYSIVEIGVTGKYKFSCTPESVGNWHIFISTANEVWEDDIKIFNILTRDISDTHLNISYNNELDIIYFDAWLERSGQFISSGLVSCVITLYNNEGTELVSLNSISPLPNGHFSLSTSISTFENTPYSVIVVITDTMGEVTTSQSFAAV